MNNKIISRRLRQIEQLQVEEKQEEPVPPSENDEVLRKTTERVDINYIQMEDC